MSNNTQFRGTPFNVVANGTTSAQAVTTGTSVIYYVTDISGTATATTSGTWTLLCGPTGTTVMWAGAGLITEVFGEPLVATRGTISFLVNGSAFTYANISGYFI